VAWGKDNTTGESRIRRADTGGAKLLRTAERKDGARVMTGGEKKGGKQGNLSERPSRELLYAEGPVNNGGETAGKDETKLKRSVKIGAPGGSRIKERGNTTRGITLSFRGGDGL